VKIERGRAIDFDRSVVRTIVPGKVRVARTAKLKTRTFGRTSSVKKTDYEGPAVRGALLLETGDQFEVLAYHEAGDCFLRADGIVHLAACPNNDPDSFEVLLPFKTEWWLRYKTLREEGWFRSDAPGVGFAARGFSGE